MWGRAAGWASGLNGTRRLSRRARRRRAALRAEAAVCGGWPRKEPELAGTCRDKRLDF